VRSTSMKNKSIIFTSTRNNRARISFWDSIIAGLASDGGLLVPVNFPKISRSLLKSKKFWSDSSASEFAISINRLFVPPNELTTEELSKGIKKAINFNLPLEYIDKNIFVLRIDRGPTASFKDIAARTLAFLMDQYALKFDKKINIIVATSGDTGVAIADAFGNKKNISVTVLYPNKAVSEIQEKQMLEVHHKYENEQVVPIDGNFDNCQDIAKLLQTARNIDINDEVSKSKFIDDVKIKLNLKISKEQVNNLAYLIKDLNLSSANSINIWRLIPQMTQYFSAYGQLVKQNKIKPGQEIIFSVPTGNAGHLLAGIYAKEIGLPIKRFILGVNTNNILANIIGSGIVRHRPFKNSSSPSMDILDPSNLERLLDFVAKKTSSKKPIDYVSMKNDIKKVKNENESFSLYEYGVTKKMLSYLQDLIWIEDVETDEEVYGMMEYVYNKTGVLLEPHGITAYISILRAQAKGLIHDRDVMVMFETAHPDKFKNSLVRSGLENAKRFRHNTLERLKKVSIKDLNKSKVQKADIIQIAKKVKSIAK